MNPAAALVAMEPAEAKFARLTIRLLRHGPLRRQLSRTRGGATVNGAAGDGFSRAGSDRKPTAVSLGSGIPGTSEEI